MRFREMGVLALLFSFTASVGVTAVDSCESSSGIRVVAHRGSMLEGHPENTVESIRWAASMGISTVELDVRPSRDGQAVLIHDATLARTTNGTGAVRTKSLKQLQELDAGSGFRIPTLSEGLNAARALGLGVLLDFKGTHHLDMAEISNQIHTVQPPGGIIVGVRTVRDLKAVRATGTKVRTLGFVRNTDEIDSFIAGGVNMIRLWGHRVLSTPELVTRIQDRNVEVWVTTGQTQGAKLSRILEAGVDAVITDVPDQLILEQCCC